MTNKQNAANELADSNNAAKTCSEAASHNATTSANCASEATNFPKTGEFSEKTTNRSQASFLERFWVFFNSWTGSVIFVLLFIFFVAQAFTIPSGSMKNSLLIGDHLVVSKFSYGIPRPYLPFAEIPLLPDFRGDNHLVRMQGPKRGDIVVFRSVENEKMHYIKRCVAEPHDKVIYAKKHLFVSMHEGDEYMKSHYPSEQLITIAGRLYVIEPYRNPGVHYDPRVDFDRVIEAYRAAGHFAMQPTYYAELDEYLAQNGAAGEYQAYEFTVSEDEYFMMGDNRDHSNDSRFWGAVPYKNIEGKPLFVYLSWDEDYHIRWQRMFKGIERLTNDRDLIIHEETKLEALD